MSRRTLEQFGQETFEKIADSRSYYLIPDEIAALAAYVRQLQHRLEREEICHAGCGAIVGCNTRASLDEVSRGIHPDYDSHAVRTCIAAMGREIELLERSREPVAMVKRFPMETLSGTIQEGIGIIPLRYDMPDGLNLFTWPPAVVEEESVSLEDHLADLFNELELHVDDIVQVACEHLDMVLGDIEDVVDAYHAKRKIFRPAYGMTIGKNAVAYY